MTNFVEEIEQLRITCERDWWLHRFRLEVCPEIKERRVFLRRQRAKNSWFYTLKYALRGYDY